MSDGIYRREDCIPHTASATAPGNDDWQERACGNIQAAALDECRRMLREAEAAIASERALREQAEKERDREHGALVECRIGYARAIELREAAEQDAKRVRDEKNNAYRERNHVVALLARMALALGWRAGLRNHEPDPDPSWDDDWKNVVAIDLPTGQVTWHHQDDDRPLFASLPPYPAHWDGHDTAEKYRRVNSALAPGGESATPADRFMSLQAQSDALVADTHRAWAALSIKDRDLVRMANRMRAASPGARKEESDG